MHWTAYLSTLALSASMSLGAGCSAQAQQTNMSFFVTSVGSGKGADLGGLQGADQHCQQLAQAAGAGTRTWHAYLSAQAADGQPAVNARDRIERGPWQNSKGVVVAKDVDDPAQQLALLDCLPEFHFGDEKSATAGAQAEEVAHHMRRRRHLCRAFDHLQMPQ